MQIPTRKLNEFILSGLAQQNKNLDTSKWRIAHRRPKGATKSTLFLRMDRESFRTIEDQGMKVNWILGTVQLELERQGKNETPALPSNQMDPPSVMEKQPKSTGLTYGGSVPMSQCHQTKEKVHNRK